MGNKDGQTPPIPLCQSGEFAMQLRRGSGEPAAPIVWAPAALAPRGPVGHKYFPNSAPGASRTPKGSTMTATLQARIGEVTERIAHRSRDSRSALP